MTGDQPLYQQLRGYLAELRLAAAADKLAEHLYQAQQTKPSYTAFLHALLRVEVDATDKRRRDGRLRLAGFPHHKPLEDFDYDAQPGLDRRLVDELATLRFIDTKSNALLIGRPGVGKTTLAIGLGLKAIDAGYRVYYTTAADLVTRTAKAIHDGRWQTTMRFWNGPQLLLIDELGYLPLADDAANYLFHVISRRYEHGSIILTTNRGIADWGTIFPDTVVATAILDRLLHHAAVITINGPSYRMRRHQARVDQLRDSLADPTRPPSTGGEFS